MKTTYKDVISIVLALVVFTSAGFGTGTKVDIGDLAITRSSIAYDTEFNQVDANAIRTEQAAVSTNRQIEFATSLDYDVAAVDGNIILCLYYYKLLRFDAATFDPVNPTGIIEVINVQIDDSAGDNIFKPYNPYGITRISGVHVAAPGVWIVGTDENAYNSNADGHLFRTGDYGATWTHVLTMTSGHMPNWSSMGQYGDTLVVGTYGANPSTGGHDRVYLSDDLGVTWSEIYERNDYGTGTDEPTASGTHVHFCTMIDENTALVQFGDALPRIYGENNLLVKLTRNGASWNATTIRQYGSNPVQGYNVGDGYIYFGRDASFGAAIERYKISDGTWEDVMDWPNVIGSITGTGEFIPNQAIPQRIHNGSSNLFSIIKADGIYYAASWALRPFQYSGILASPDGEHWCWIYRESPKSSPVGNFGIRYIRGVAGGYVWGTKSTESGWDKPFRMPIPKLKLIDTVRSEHSSNNHLVDIESTSGGWIPCYRGSSSHCGRIIAATEGIDSLRGDYVYKIQSDDESVSDSIVVYSPVATSNPLNGDYVVASAWVKAAPNWDRRVVGKLYIGDPDEHLGTHEYALFIPTDDWRKVTVWGKVQSDWGTSAAPFLVIRLWGAGLHPSASPADYYPLTDEEWSNCKLYIDNISITYHDSLHDSTSWQVPETTRTDEKATLNLDSYSNKDTVSFKWLPRTSSTEIHGDIGIAKLTDNSNDLAVYYDQSEGEIVAGNAGIACDWEYGDQIDIAITRLSTFIRLTVKTNKYTISHSYGSDTFDKFTQLTLGYDGTNYGVGLYGDIIIYEELTESDIGELFDTFSIAGKAVPGCEISLQADINNDCQVDYLDFAVFASEWLTCGHPDPNNCWQ